MLAGLLRCPDNFSHNVGSVCEVLSLDVVNDLVETSLVDGNSVLEQAQCVTAQI